MSDGPIDFKAIEEEYGDLIETMSDLLDCDLDIAAEAVGLVWTFIRPDEEE